MPLRSAAVDIPTNEYDPQLLAGCATFHQAFLDRVSTWVVKIIYSGMIDASKHHHKGVITGHLNHSEPLFPAVLSFTDRLALRGSSVVKRLVFRILRAGKTTAASSEFIAERNSPALSCFMLYVCHDAWMCLLVKEGTLTTSPSFQYT